MKENAPLGGPVLDHGLSSYHSLLI